MATRYFYDARLMVSVSEAGPSGDPPRPWGGEPGLRGLQSPAWEGGLYTRWGFQGVCDDEGMEPDFAGLKKTS